MVFLWIQVLFFYGVRKVDRRSSSLETTTLIFEGGSLFEIGIFDGKVGSISEEAIKLFFLLEFLERSGGADGTAKIAELFLLKFLFQDKWTIVLDLFLRLRLEIIHFQVCGRSFGLAGLVDSGKVESAAVLLLKKRALHLFELIVKNKKYKMGISAR